MDFEKLYIDGAWVPSASDKWIEVENPASRSVIARVPAGNAEDVDRAAKAASAAFPAWRDTPLADRIALMEKFLTEFRAREEDHFPLPRTEIQDKAKNFEKKGIGTIRSGSFGEEGASPGNFSSPSVHQYAGMR